MIKICNWLWCVGKFPEPQKGKREVRAAAAAAYSHFLKVFEVKGKRFLIKKCQRYVWWLQVVTMQITLFASLISGHGEKYSANYKSIVWVFGIYSIVSTMKALYDTDQMFERDWIISQAKDSPKSRSSKKKKKSAVSQFRTNWSSAWIF